MRDIPAGKVLGSRNIGPFLLVQHEYPTSVMKERHSHAWLHLAVVQEGFYSRVARSRRFDFRQGSLAFLESHEGHTDAYAAGSKCLHVVIPSDVEYRLSCDFRTGVALGEALHEVAAPASIALQHEFLSPSRSSPLIVEALLLDLVSKHLRIVCERSHLRPEWMRSLLEYLNDTFEQDWTLGKIAADLGVHPVHLCRTFSEHQKCTLGAYIRDLRLIRGWQLLWLSSEPLATVALKCGFADQSHFTRLFKQRFGVTPGAFRRRATVRRLV
jgi:AraC family transcriptional regulator